MLKAMVEERYEIVTSSIGGLLSEFKEEVERKKFIKEFVHQAREGIAEDLGKEEDEVEAEEYEEKGIALLEERWNDFEEAFSRRAKDQNGKILGYRCVAIKEDQLKKFLVALKKGKYLKGFTGIGKWFSWDEETAECHWGHGKGTSVTVVAEIPYSSLDVKQTAWANMTTEEERELTLKPGAKLFVIRVLDNQDKNLLGDGVESLPAVAEG